MIITKEIGIDMGHRIPNHKSKCRNIHGHYYRIIVGVDDKLISKEGDSSEGMVIDYNDIKTILREVIEDKFDHSFMIYDKDPLITEWEKCPTMKDMKINKVSFIPTAENISQYFYFLLKLCFLLRNVKINHVDVWETPTSSATFSIKDENDFITKNSKGLEAFKEDLDRCQKD